MLGRRMVSRFIGWSEYIAPDELANADLARKVQIVRTAILEICELIELE